MKKAHQNKYKPKEENIIFIPEATLDFHVFDKFEPFEIEQMLNEFLEDCYIEKLENVIVVVGKGQVIRPYVQKLLNTHKLVKNFKQAGYFNGQSGAYEVNLLSI